MSIRDEIHSLLERHWGTAFTQDDARLFDDLVTWAEAEMAIGLTSSQRLAEIRELHSPVPIPEGKKWMGHRPGEQPCSGCETGDPYMDDPWPCKTRKIADGTT